jgi:hypothetical protein
MKTCWSGQVGGLAEWLDTAPPRTSKRNPQREFPVYSLLKSWLSLELKRVGCVKLAVVVVSMEQGAAAVSME